MKNFHVLIACAILSACGGGGGGSGDAAPTAPPAQPAPAPTLTLSSTSIRTIAGGSAIPLTAKLSSGAAVHWQLAAGTPGTLSADSGGSVRYLPPAAGTLAAPTAVTVNASGDGVGSALTLGLTPDPGQPGLQGLAWRTSAEPTGFSPTDVAADLAGNVYVLLYVNAAPTRRGGPKLVKIGPDGTITELIGASFFGQPYPSGMDTRLRFTSGLAVDRAGNLYIAEAGGGYGIQAGEQGSTLAILKITPTGQASVLAGSEDVQTGAMTDGTGSAARFLSPRIVGIDYDDNLYVLDRNDTPRKVTPAGVVTTLAALPASLNADMNGNTYRYDAATQKLMRMSASGVSSVETSVPYCADVAPQVPPTCLSSDLSALVPAGGDSYVMLNSGVVTRWVLRH